MRYLLFTTAPLPTKTNLSSSCSWSRTAPPTEGSTLNILCAYSSLSSIILWPWQAGIIHFCQNKRQKTRKGSCPHTLFYRHRRNKKRSIFLLLGTENVNKPLRCLIRNDADGRHSFFTEVCQHIPAVLTRKTTERTRAGGDLTPACDRRRLKHHPGPPASDHTTLLEVMAWGCLRTRITLSEVLLKTVNDLILLLVPPLTL